MAQPYNEKTYDYFKKPLPVRLMASIREGRFRKGMQDWLEWHVFVYPVGAYHALVSREFVFEGRRYRYYVHSNGAVSDERTLEIPIAKAFIEENKPKNMLEVGNVLGIHFKAGVNHTVVDKYEKGEGIINEDIVDYKPDRKFDMVISLSTMEHVGFDEELKDASKTEKSMRNILSMLEPDGKLLITVPVGYNPAMDDYIRNTRLDKRFMLKTSAFNDWVETTEEEAFRHRSDSKYRRSNAVAIIRKI
ncbi:MAG: hypothetical protein ABSE71_04990 [Candidatus Micrarchaeaceae archaeon]|jgi:SAM-dependent methyltransferase|nr:class I SAM-dependent methyltransferase [Candidatus Micrarchaeota archaeon]